MSIDLAVDLSTYLRQQDSTSFAPVIEQIATQSGESITKVRLNGRAAWVITDPKIAKMAMASRPNAFTRSSILASMRQGGDDAAAVLPPGLFQAEGDVWRRHRTLTAPAFFKKHLATMFDSVVLVAKRLTEKAAQSLGPTGEGAWTATQDVPRATLDVTALVGFGRDLNLLLEPQPISEDFANIFPSAGRNLAAAVLGEKVDETEQKKGEASRGRVLVMLLECIQEEKASMELDEPQTGGRYRSEQERMNLNDNLLRRMLMARKESNEKKHLDDTEILSNSFTFMLAGHDTTSHTVSWMLYHIARLPVS
jgi:cytochrome P450